MDGMGMWPIICWASWYFGVLLTMRVAQGWSSIVFCNMRSLGRPFLKSWIYIHYRPDTVALGYLFVFLRTFYSKNLDFLPNISANYIVSSGSTCDSPKHEVLNSLCGTYSWCFLSNGFCQKKSPRSDGNGWVWNKENTKGNAESVRFQNPYHPCLGGGFKYFLFSSLFGEMIQFD